MNDTDDTRRSWNVATRNHNAHKGDQAAWLAGGGDTLFAEELALLGPLAGRKVVHLQCNAGQDTLCLARRGADVLGVDLSDEAIGFARKLSTDSGIAAEFVEAEILHWLATTDRRFDVAFTSYGTTGWLQDLGAWARGVHRILNPGGVLVYVEFHPLVWSIGRGPDPTILDLSGDDYFSKAPFHDPVGDYVAMSGAALGAVQEAETAENVIPATSWQHTLADTLQAVLDAGLRLDQVQEWPYANGCRVVPGLIPLDDRRWTWPPLAARVPLMFGIHAVRPE